MPASHKLIFVITLCCILSEANPSVLGQSAIPKEIQTSMQNEKVLLKDCVLNEFPLDAVQSGTVSAINNLLEATGGSPKKLNEFDGKKATPVEIVDSGSQIDDPDYAHKIVNGKAHEVTFSKNGEVKFLKVRLLNGKEKGKVGWVAKEYVGEMSNVFEIEKTTGRARQITKQQLDEIYNNSVPDELLSGAYFIVRMRTPPEHVKTAMETIEMINDPSKCTKLVEHAVRKLQSDAGSYPDNYYINFSKEMFVKSISFSETDPDEGVNRAGKTFGEIVESTPQVLPAYHIYAALVETSKDTGYDKVQHFSRSARLQYFNLKWYTDLLQYGKERLGLDMDWLDMKANNQGQKFGQELYDRYYSK